MDNIAHHSDDTNVELLCAVDVEIIISIISIILPSSSTIDVTRAVEDIVIGRFEDCRGTT